MSVDLGDKDHNSQQAGRRGNEAVGSIDLGFIWSKVLTLGELFGQG